MDSKKVRLLVVTTFVIPIVIDTETASLVTCPGCVKKLSLHVCAEVLHQQACTAKNSFIEAAVILQL